MIFETLLDEDRGLLNDFRQLVSPIEIDEDIEGQSAYENRIKIGCRAGPSMCLSNLVHEICHFIEIDQRRMSKHGWGLKFGKRIEIPGYSVFYEMFTAQAIEREVRVWAMQKNFSEAKNVKFDLEDIVESARFINCFGYVKGSSDKEKFNCIKDMILMNAERPEYSFQALQQELLRRTAKLRAKISVKKVDIQFRGV